MDGDVEAAADVERLQGVARCLLDGDVARNRRESDDLDARRLQCHDYRHRVVRGGVGVDQQKLVGAPCIVRGCARDASTNHVEIVATGCARVKAESQ